MIVQAGRSLPAEEELQRQHIAPPQATARRRVSVRKPVRLSGRGRLFSGPVKATDETHHFFVSTRKTADVPNKYVPVDTTQGSQMVHLQI